MEAGGIGDNMADKPEIIKVDRTDANVDNSRYELKVPYEVEDDYGTKVTLYRKEVILSLDTLLSEKAIIEKALVDIEAKIAEVQKLNEPEEIKP